MNYKRFVEYINLFLLLTATLLLIFLMLSGATTTGVLQHFFWLQATTAGFNMASNITKWYNYRSCGLSWFEIGIMTCSRTRAAYPFSPLDNFGFSPNIPSSFVKHRDTYFFLSRIAWGMLFLGFIFVITTLILSLFSLSRPSNRIFVPWAPLFLHCCAFFFILLSAALYTGCFVKGKEVFANAKRNARLGTNNFVFIWVSVGILLVCVYLALILKHGDELAKIELKIGRNRPDYRALGRHLHLNPDLEKSSPGTSSSPDVSDSSVLRF
ncbi:hypothetical protein NCAS_0G01690 [Naumovozyma castellii]|uniref:Protein SUR7 n=1 Tax=Naumovozyma castellii TaxID=27288 RepID=G0VI22_NAUCA|nr:hypothetical protein NCAS_0G01690 [Naumovozyma castellii CBS 4309]CCC71056.1 hypothetical protein NCAS_0G01690 [Naumovozyma castellii CBS 4309]